jgi:hypothetical protein
MAAAAAVVVVVVVVVGWRCRDRGWEHRGNGAVENGINDEAEKERTKHFIGNSPLMRLNDADMAMLNACIVIFRDDKGLVMESLLKEARH